MHLILISFSVVAVLQRLQGAAPFISKHKQMKVAQTARYDN